MAEEADAIKGMMNRRQTALKRAVCLIIIPVWMNEKLLIEAVV